jgi:hypothetical protein
MTRAVPAPLVACAAWFCACSTPTPQIVLGLAGPPAQAQACPGDCMSIPLPCDAAMSIRIVDPGADPSDASKRYIDQCVSVPPNTNQDICALNQINLDSRSVPVRDLAVQIAVFPGSMVRVDALNNKLVCPDVAYSSATGFPIEQALAPALGGQTFYHPGDAIVHVTLGCTDLSATQAGETCHNPTAGAVTATVVDFETQVPVTVGPDGIANNLFVWSGEPHIFGGSYVLHPADVVAMHLDDNGTPHWTAEAAQTFERYACVEVLEDVTQTIATLHCAPAADPIGKLTGYWLLRDNLEAIAKMALGSAFPDAGLTIGMVVDATASGVSNVAIKTSGPAHITYLSATGQVGREATFNNGIFVSDDAPFGTMFSASGARAAVGGLVAGKATIVIVPMGAPAQ